MRTIVVILIVFVVTTLYSQNEEYVESGDNVIHLMSYGEGQPILIINRGPGMNSEGFKSLAKIIGKSDKAIL